MVRFCRHQAYDVVVFVVEAVYNCSDDLPAVSFRICSEGVCLGVQENNMKKALKDVVLCFVVMPLIGVYCVGCSWAAGLPELPLGTFEFPPFNYTENGKVVGVSTEIASEILRGLGYKPVITSYPWKRTLIMADRGEIAGLFTYTLNERRKRATHVTMPLGAIYDVFFKRRTSNINLERMGDLKGYIIGATDGYNYAPVFLKPLRSGFIKSDMIASKNPELQHLKKLAKGRIDLAICEISLCSHIIRQHSELINKIHFIDKKIGPVRNFHMGFSKKWPGSKKLRDRFDEAFARLKASGRVTEIYNRYHVVKPVP